MAFSFVHVLSDGPRRKPALDAHNRGDSRPRTAIPRAEFEYKASLEIAPDEGVATPVLAAIKEQNRAERRRGRPPSQRVRLLFGHPPPFEAADAWPHDRLKAWSRDSAAWLRRHVERASAGAAIVERVDLHVDELRPHLHATVIPVMPRPGMTGPVAAALADFGPGGVPAANLRLSWRELQFGMFPPAPVKGQTPASASMCALQDSYHAEVGRRYGMERGKPSDAIRSEPDRLEGLKTRVRLSDERAQRVEREALQKVAEADRRSRQKSRAARVDRDANARKHAWLKHGARKLLAENRRLVAERDARSRSR